MPVEYLRFNWNRFVLLGLAATASSVAAASSCADQAISWQTAYVSNLSDWKEFDAAGRMLVHESGPLQGGELSAGFQCNDWTAQAALTQLVGTRLYDGQTTSGTSVTSRSALRQSKGHLQTSLRVFDDWQLAMRTTGQTTWREIASADGAAGYPERFDWTLLSIGSQWKTSLGPGQLTLAAWAGSQLSSSMVLSLPGRDQTVLQLGPIRQFELAVEWRTALSPAWSLQSDARYRRTDIGQGADAVVTRSGIPAGVAHQPRTSTVDIPLAIRIDYQF